MTTNSNHHPLSADIPHSIASTPPIPPHFQLRGGLALETVGGKPNKLPPNAPGQIAQSCLLIPVFVAAWFYWTKKVCRRVARRVFLKEQSEEQDASSSSRFHDRFYRFGEAGKGSMSSYDVWDELNNHHHDDSADSIHENDENTRTGNRDHASERFVKWINAGNVHRRVQKKQLRVLTRRQLYGDQATTSGSQSLMMEPTNNPPPTHLSRNEMTPTSMRPSSPAVSEWECLTDIGTSVVELCSVTQEGLGVGQLQDDDKIIGSEQGTNEGRPKIQNEENLAKHELSENANHAAKGVLS